MEYKFEEYDRVMDTPNRSLEERAIVEKIMSILNSNKKYSSLEEFYKANLTIDEFKKNNDMENVLKHFGNKLNQEDYEKIITSLRKLTVQKLDFDKNGINTTSIGDKEYITYEGKDEKFYLNNSYSNTTIEEQLKNLQQESSEFQTADIKENTNRLMKEIKEKKKIDLILRYLNEINYEVLNENQQKLFKFAFDYQQNTTGLIRIDLDEKVMVDEDDNIMKIDELDGKLVITKEDQKYSSSENEKEEQNKVEKKLDSPFTLKKMPNTNLF